MPGGPIRESGIGKNPSARKQEPPHEDERYISMPRHILQRIAGTGNDAGKKSVS
jgi:hypothetical protein